ncbi:MAG: sel1 repeat family protein [Alphaproteobacteria bacterium]|nr:sel1 repeat family protein [Alphaproteobacteria bacterium]
MIIGWRTVVGGSAVLAAVVAGAVLAIATIDPPPLRKHHAKPTLAAVETSDEAPAFGRDLTLPPLSPPPQPTTDEIMQGIPAPAAGADSSGPARAADIAKLSFEELRRRANRDDLPAMEEMARRLVSGNGIAKDTEAGAGWTLRAAERGSAQAAFNAGVMYERGFVVERDDAKAAQWYRRSADLGFAEARHNLALMLRTGKGVPRDGAQAIQLLRTAARQGMTASMFTLGDIYETGDAAPKDIAAAAAWFSITAAVESQNNKDGETTLAVRAGQRAEALQRLLTPEELAKARETAQNEYHAIVAALSPNPKDEGKPLPEPALPDPAK